MTSEEELEIFTGGTAHDVVKTLVDAYAERGIPLAPRYKGILARNAKELLQAGFDFPTVSVAAAIALRRGAPWLLQHIAQDLVMARQGEMLSYGAYRKQLEDEVELARAQHERA